MSHALTFIKRKIWWKEHYGIEKQFNQIDNNQEENCHATSNRFQGFSAQIKRELVLLWYPDFHLLRDFFL